MAAEMDVRESESLIEGLAKEAEVMEAEVVWW
jgi:hypothetical protein